MRAGNVSVRPFIRVVANVHVLYHRSSVRPRNPTVWEDDTEKPFQTLQ